MPTSNTFQTLERQLRYTEALARCSHTLLQSSQGTELDITVLNQALNFLVEGTGVARIGLFQAHQAADHSNYAKIVAEATLPEFASRLELLRAERIPMSAETTSKLRARRVVNVFLNRTLDPNELNALDVRSLLLCPLLIQDKYWGYLAYGAAENERVWSGHERMLLQTAADLFARAIENWNTQAHLNEQQRQLTLLIDFIRLADNPQNTEHVLQVTAEFIVHRVQMAQCLIYFCPNPAQTPRTFRVISPDNAESDALAKHARCLELRDAALLQNQPCLSEPDTQNKNKAFAQENGIDAILALPMLAGSDIQAVMLAIAPAQVRDPFSPNQTRLLETIARQAGISIQNAQLYERTQQIAVIEERTRLSRELHDSVTQALYSLVLQADGGIRLINADKMDDMTTYLAELGDTALQALKELRLLVYELRPTAFIDETLQERLRKRLNNVEERAGVSTQLVIDPQITFTQTEQDALWGIAQEALNNALKHAQAHNVNVYLGAKSGARVLEIRDDGVGFELPPVREQCGFGMQTMRERADAIGGIITVESALGTGTTIRVEVPA